MDTLTNIPIANPDMMEILTEVFARDLKRHEEFFSALEQLDKYEGSIKALILFSFNVQDPHLILDESEIKRQWSQLFEHDPIARRFLMSLHSRFILAIGKDNYDVLLRDQAESLAVINENGIFDQTNYYLKGDVALITKFLRQNSWVFTLLLIGHLWSRGRYE